MPEGSNSDNALLPRAECSAERGLDARVAGLTVSHRQSSYLPLLSHLHLHVLLMKLTLKQQLRPRPFASMLGFLDLKTGATLVVLFAVRLTTPTLPALLTLVPRCSTRSLVFTASLPFSLAQVAMLLNLPSTSTPPSPLSVLRGESGLSMTFVTLSDSLPFFYSLCAIQENPKHMLYFAHIFFADHILNTIWTVYFAVHWWLYTPHDGRRNANSPAQQALIDGYIGEHQSMSEAERIAAAERVWHSEKAQALTIIILGWLIKVRLVIQPELSPCPLFLVSGYKSSTSPLSCIHLHITSAEEAIALSPSHAQICTVRAQAVQLSRRTPTPPSPPSKEITAVIVSMLT